MKIDLNSDLGESFGAWKTGNDAELIPLITSANIACGFHAGDPSVMLETVRTAREAGISIGAHPGFHDIEGFGRRNISVSPDTVYAETLYQLGALNAAAKAAGMSLQHVKPHGALYNMAAKDIRLADAVCRAVRDFDPDLIMLASGSGELYRSAVKLGLRAAAEVFADRGYSDDGTLVPRGMPGAMIHDPLAASERVVRMIREHKATSAAGKEIEIRADSVCVHGDNEKALEFVRALRTALISEGIEIVPLNQIV